MIAALAERIAELVFDEGRKLWRERRKQAGLKVANGEDLQNIEAVALLRNSGKLGFGKAIIAIVVLTPLVVPYFDLGFTSAAADKVVGYLSFGDYGYDHLAVGLVCAAFGIGVAKRQ